MVSQEFLRVKRGGGKSYSKSKRVQKVQRVLSAFGRQVQRVVVSPLRAMSLYAAEGGTYTGAARRPPPPFEPFEPFEPFNNPFIYPIKRGISSLGDETITLAPWERRKGRVRKPQLTEIQGRPAFFAVSISTSESPM